MTPLRLKRVAWAAIALAVIAGAWALYRARILPDVVSEAATLAVGGIGTYWRAKRPVPPALQPAAAIERAVLSAIPSKIGNTTMKTLTLAANVTDNLPGLPGSLSVPIGVWEVDDLVGAIVGAAASVINGAASRASATSE